jgi:hypothetical protein
MATVRTVGRCGRQSRDSGKAGGARGEITAAAGVRDAVVDDLRGRCGCALRPGPKPQGRRFSRNRMRRSMGNISTRLRIWMGTTGYSRGTRRIGAGRVGGSSEALEQLNLVFSHDRVWPTVAHESYLGQVSLGGVLDVRIVVGYQSPDRGFSSIQVTRQRNDFPSSAQRCA